MAVKQRCVPILPCFNRFLRCYLTVRIKERPSGKGKWTINAPQREFRSSATIEAEQKHRTTRITSIGPAADIAVVGFVASVPSLGVVVCLLVRWYPTSDRATSTTQPTLTSSRFHSIGCIRKRKSNIYLFKIGIF